MKKNIIALITLFIISIFYTLDSSANATIVNSYRSKRMDYKKDECRSTADFLTKVGSRAGLSVHGLCIKHPLKRYFFQLSHSGRSHRGALSYDSPICLSYNGDPLVRELEGFSDSAGLFLTHVFTDYRHRGKRCPRGLYNTLFVEWIGR